MPKLGRYNPVIDCVFFLYQSEQDAKDGLKSGGTGFLVAVPSLKWPGKFHVHGVTNWHVAVKSTDSHKPAPCIRINGRLTGIKIFDFSAGEWLFKKDSYDVAISPPLLIDQDLYKASFLDIDSFFLTHSQELTDEVGPGEDVFMVGRFIDYDGIENNSPAFRFGHISVTNATIRQSTGYVGRSILLDMNSRGGFSGSPVFVFRTIGSYFFDSQPGKFLTGGGHYLKLLGIHEGQFPERWELKNIEMGSSSSSLTWENESSRNILATDGNYIVGLSGMTRVIPTACIKDDLLPIN